MVEILVDIEVVCPGGFDQAVDDGACFSSVYRVMEQEVLPPHDIAFGLSLRRIVRKLEHEHFVHEVVHQALFLVLCIDNGCRKLAPLYGMELLKPLIKRLDDRPFFLQADLHPVLFGAAFVLPLQSEQAVDVGDTDLTGGHGSPLRFLRRDGIEKLTSQMRIASDTYDVLQRIVSGVSVTVDIPGEAFQEILCVLAFSPGMIIIEHDPGPSVIPCEIDPHVGLGLRAPARFLKHLAGDLVRVDDVPHEEILMEPLEYRPKVIEGTFDDPVRHRASVKPDPMLQHV